MKEWTHGDWGRLCDCEGGRDDGGDGEEVAEGLHGFRGRAGCAREGVCGVRGAEGVCAAGEIKGGGAWRGLSIGGRGSRKRGPGSGGQWARPWQSIARAKPGPRPAGPCEEPAAAPAARASPACPEHAPGLATAPERGSPSTRCESLRLVLDPPAAPPGRRARRGEEEWALAAVVGLGILTQRQPLGHHVRPDLPVGQGIRAPRPRGPVRILPAGRGQQDRRGSGQDEQPAARDGDSP